MEWLCPLDGAVCPRCKAETTEVLHTLGQENKHVICSGLVWKTLHYLHSGREPGSAFLWGYSLLRCTGTQRYKLSLAQSRGNISLECDVSQGHGSCGTKSVQWLPKNRGQLLEVSGKTYNALELSWSEIFGTLISGKKKFTYYLVNTNSQRTT